ncbi:MAG TPA: ergothioneine biosynthesis protein EgtB [Phycisphaerae bacterium]|nr:ergothioneine biosynthesis protein EgtB [Phycisphaerae bacterium]
MALPAVALESPAPFAGTLLDRYQAVREQTSRLCLPLSPEDCVIQSMPDASPVRWHIAHTTWFFETFILTEALAGYRPFSKDFAYLFNSYYNAVGPQFPRASRGAISRPSVQEIFDYRRYVDHHMIDLLAGGDYRSFQDLIELGIQHEQQHQELILTDLKHMLSINPLCPAYSKPGDTGTDAIPASNPSALRWTSYAPAVCRVGQDSAGFAFDNEKPVHRVFIEPFELASRLTTNQDYLQFIEHGGYEAPKYWLSEGWNIVNERRWRHPLYWVRQYKDWMQFTLRGLRPLDPLEPVSHISFFEADAYARWAGARLATEFEWEMAARQLPIRGNFLESELLVPVAASSEQSVQPAQLFGDLWEWTGSAYLPYPGYQPSPGAVGEYNGKFMCNQFVLRGGSCATPQSHIRATYRNFFPPQARWQFTGIRLARSL